MTETTQHRDLAAILADLDCPPSPYGTGDEFYRELELAVRAQLAPLPEGETDRLAEQAARIMAPPVPGVTVNAGKVVRAVIYLHPHENGLLESWAVACEDTERGAWVTWVAYALDHPGLKGVLAYDAGVYFEGPDPKDNRRRALASMTGRAGAAIEVCQAAAREITADRYADPEDRRMARRMLRYFTRNR